jgi:hypothetical protein
MQAVSAKDTMAQINKEQPPSEAVQEWELRKARAGRGPRRAGPSPKDKAAAQRRYDDDKQTAKRNYRKEKQAFLNEWTRSASGEAWINKQGVEMQTPERIARLAEMERNYKSDLADAKEAYEAELDALENRTRNPNDPEGLF